MRKKVNWLIVFGRKKRIIYKKCWIYSGKMKGDLIFLFGIEFRKIFCMFFYVYEIMIIVVRNVIYR